MVLDRLGCREKTSLQGGRALELRSISSNTFQPRDVFFGLSFALFECGFELFRLRGLGHFGQGAEDFLFREIDVVEGLVKQVLQVLRR